MRGLFRNYKKRILSSFFADRIGVNHWFLISGILIIGIAINCPMMTEIRKIDSK